MLEWDEFYLYEVIDFVRLGTVTKPTANIAL